MFGYLIVYKEIFNGCYENFIYFLKLIFRNKMCMLMGEFFFKDLIYIIYDILYLNISWFIFCYSIVINKIYLF